MEVKYDQTIGVIGGMGSYATLDFFHRLLTAFPAEKDWDRPRIIIDNRCTMPSRVRAILYGEAVEEVAEQLADSTRNLIRSGADILVLACNTSHVFLPRILEQVPEAEGRFVNIIASLKDSLLATGEHTFRLMGSEGTLDSQVYQKHLEPFGIEIEAPQPEDYVVFRSLIEDVKQDMVTDETVARFIEAVHTGGNKNVILGCTEFPPIYRLAADQLASEGYRMFDPLDTTIQQIKSIIA